MDRVQKEGNMSQVNVERVIGVLATDEKLRRLFTRDPKSALLEMVRKGMDLNATELWSLACPRLPAPLMHRCAP